MFLAPIEIHHALYAYLIPGGVHLFLRQGKARFTACVEPSPSDDLDGFERRTTGYFLSDTIWARRLRSSWGLHWKCKETLSRMNDNEDAWITTSVLLLACKRL
jgi:hypothetical protein